MISSEQVRLAARHLHKSEAFCHAAAPCEVSPELLAKVHLYLDGVADYREDRVESARIRIESGPPASAEIANMMIGRIVSDSIR